MYTKKHGCRANCRFDFKQKNYGDLCNYKNIGVGYNCRFDRKKKENKNLSYLSESLTRFTISIHEDLHASRITSVQ